MIIRSILLALCLVISIPAFGQSYTINPLTGQLYLHEQSTSQERHNQLLQEFKDQLYEQERTRQLTQQQREQSDRAFQQYWCSEITGNSAARQDCFNSIR